MVQSLTLPRNALILRKELCKLLEKGAIKRLPASKLFQLLFSGAQERWRTPPDTTGPSTERSASVHSGRFCWNRSWSRFAPGTGCVCGFKGRVLSHSDSLASHAFSQVCSRGNSVPVPCSPVWAGFVPTHFLEVHGRGSPPPPPPRSERDAGS